jgi:hypothetical protein
MGDKARTVKGLDDTFHSNDFGTGSFTIDGGFGNDTFVFDHADPMPVSEGDVPVAVVELARTYILGTQLNGSTLRSFENLVFHNTGNAEVHIYGTFGDNNLNLDGGGAWAFVSARAGNDTITVDNVNVVNISPQEGNDTVNLGSNYDFAYITDAGDLSLTFTTTGNETYNLGAGVDTVTYGTGNSPTTSVGKDVINNFTVGADTLYFNDDAGGANVVESVTVKQNSTIFHMADGGLVKVDAMLTLNVDYFIV